MNNPQSQIPEFDERNNFLLMLLGLYSLHCTLSEYLSAIPRQNGTEKKPPTSRKTRAAVEPILR